MSEEWLDAGSFAKAAGITPQAARKAIAACRRGKRWKGALLITREVRGRGGRGGQRYEIAAKSLPEDLQLPFSGLSEASENTLTALPTAKFVAAPNQSELEQKRLAVLHLVMATEPRTAKRAEAIRAASLHHNVNIRTIQRWVARCETHGWDSDALGRKRPGNAGRRRSWVSRQFDKRFLAAGYSQAELEALAEWTTRIIAGWWQSPVQRAGWKRVGREAITSLQTECHSRGFDLPRTAFNLSRRRIEELRFHCAVDVMNYDAKRHDDVTPRIRRDNSLFAPMEQIVMDVKHIDCILLRPDGTTATPKLIGFQDSGTHRLFCRIFLLEEGEGVRQEHVTDSFLEMVQDPEWGFPQRLYFDNGAEFKQFDSAQVREALKMINAVDTRVIVHARAYNAPAKSIESKFSVIDRQIFSQILGFLGPDRMNKKTAKKGRPTIPFPGSIDDFRHELSERLLDFHAMPIASGPFKGRSPMEVFHGHLDNGWRPVAVDRLALDCAFAKQLGPRKIDRGAMTIEGVRYRHPELAAFSGRRVQVAKPYRRDALPLANLPEIGWVALEQEMLWLPADISGAVEASRLQKKHNQAVRRLKSKAEPVDPMGNVRARVAALPTRAAPAPLIDILMSSEAEAFAGARIEAERKRLEQPSNEQRQIARQITTLDHLEKKHGTRKS